MKPIRVFFSPLSRRFYASRAYVEDGQIVTITGQKFDVTDQIAALIKEHNVTFVERKEDAE